MLSPCSCRVQSLCEAWCWDASLLHDQIFVCLEVARREAGSPFIFSRARSIPLAKIASERCGMSVLLFATDLAENPAQQCSEEVLRTVAKYEALSWHSLKERQRLVAR